ncbi:MAG: DUF4173 domain-containing protein [Ruminococcaceae bacterium]|nr:DUF4173 domain-containing protein [Oscillospiraceae bacterium]
MDNQNVTDNYIPYTPKIKNEYTFWDTLIAFLVFPVSFFFVRADDYVKSPLGWILTSLLLCTVSLVYLKKSGTRLSQNKFSVILLLTAVLLTFSLFFTSNAALQSTVAFLVTLLYLYSAFSITGNSAENRPSSLFPLELLKAVIIMPLGSLFCCFEALSKTKKSKNIGKTLILIIAGLAIAFIPTVIVLALLSYDESFRLLTNKIFDLGDFDVFRLIADLIFTLPLALYIFGALYSNQKKRFADILNSEKCRKVSEKVRFAPTVLVCSAATPFILIYSVFFISQLDYYLSAFSGVLPDGLSYANYAREGFFQLCAVSAINALIILCMTVFSKRLENGKTPLLLRIFNILMTVLTLVLIATAISKMALYIGTYGLTVKRVFSSAFMIFLAVVFIALLIKQFAKKTNVILTALVTAVLICGTLAFCDVNGCIATYNTEHYLSGDLENLDYPLLHELGDSGIIALDRIANETNDEVIKAVLRTEAEHRGDTSFFSLTLPSIRAEKILDKYK